MFSKFFRRGKGEPVLSQTEQPGANWAYLGADMHSHFVPGIDDGAKTIEDSIVLLKAMAEMGYKKVVTTPHVMSDFYKNTSATILSGLDQLREAVEKHQIDLQVGAAAEYYIDEYFVELLDKEPLLTVYKNEVLVEFSMLFEPPMLNKTLFAMQAAGYKPIIAHPERYVFFHKDMERFQELKDRGCLLQLNLLAVTGYYGRNIMNVAHELLEKRMYDYCGSDMHHERHAAALRGMLGSKAYGLVCNYPFVNNRLCF